MIPNMQRVVSRILLYAFGTLVLLPASAAAAVETLPLDQIRPGMVGVGRTVFQGSKIEDFKVTVIGVLENVGPLQSMILAKLEGGPLAETGVIAGMSGSPVFIDGKLIGAVAYGFPFSKETIGGITPIAEMIAATRTDAPRAASTRFGHVFRAASFARPLDRDALMAALKRPLPGVAADPALLRGALPPALHGATLQPLALPLVFSGFDSSAFDFARGLFAGMGFTPMLGMSKSSLPQTALPDLQPGGAVGVSLVEGDLDLSATGTITHIDNGQVYAFGHPFYNLGPTQFPMKKAYVYSVFPSLYQSWKISSAADLVGTFDQDRMTAIAGKIGKTPRMIPISVKLRTSRGQERSFAFRMVDDELFSPVLAFVSLLSVLQSNERAYGTSTMGVDAKVTFGGGRQVQVEDLFTEEGPAMRSAALVAAPLAYLMANDFEPVKIEKLDVNVTSFETVKTALLERAWLEQSGPLKAGQTVTLKLSLRTYRGETLSESIPVAIPANAPAGTYSLLVADGTTVTNVEQREARQQFVPRDLDQLVRAINGLRRNNRIYVRLIRNDEGAIVSGEYMQSLPPSVLAVLGNGDQGRVQSVRMATLWDADVTTDYVFSGSRLLTLALSR
jgi:hypothetical protein